MRSILLLVAAATLSAETSPSKLDRFEQELAAHHVKAAGATVSEMVHERVPGDGIARPDPLLNAMLGRVYLISRRSIEAAAYLDNAPIGSLPVAIRARTALDHGRALELHGERTAALQAYREAAAAAQTDDEHQRAAIGIARQLLVDDPASARQALLSLANGPPNRHRWEARYVLALSSSLGGDAVSARQFADQAWSDAASAQLTDLAPLRVEMLRAGLAAAANDPITERTMLTAANGLNLTASPALNSQLPVCGDSGVRPTDWVMFGFAAGPFTTRELMPIAASRLEVVRTFLTTLAGTVPIKEGVDGETPFATVLTVRCRTVVSQNFIASRPIGDPLVKWTIEKGLYPAGLWNDANNDHLNATQDWIDTLSKRFGSDSPLLILPRWQVMYMLSVRAGGGDPVLPSQLTDLQKQVASGLRKAGGPEWMASTIELQSELQQSATQAASADLGSKIGALMRQQFQIAPFEMARPMLLGALSNIHGEWPPEAAQMVLDKGAHLPASLTLRERQAWQLDVAAALRYTGRDDEAKRSLVAAGLPADICPAMDSSPRLLEQHFTYDDYPDNMIVGEQEGSVLFEFNLTKDGAVADPRAIYSLPSGLFDEVSLKGVSSVRYNPPTRNGIAVPCRGVYQPIVWRLEDNDKFTFPILMPQPAGPIT